MSRRCYHRRVPMASLQSVRGFGLIEILVAMLIVAIGLLGIAVLQAKGHKFAHGSYQRTLAVHKAHEMADRMRANRAGVAQGYYNDLQGLPATHIDCAEMVCLPEQLASFDHYEWNATIAEILPSGQGIVSGAGLNSVFTITVAWDELRNDATGLGCNPDNSDDLACVSIDVRL